ncbi:GNAT family N-acetyltransferase [Acetohalobium arabaticum]|uniref:GCN5-related N-acetyltransferase n=1 Tax=Acetohalobium arabaticum (strain ATCC 49924 / DSM 5501 / Z-7288) TaxID=574087 RepID=D9QPP6_ACEAZ|nr:GNAT family N-acetyltransferase [Acetohalobium arabaticum]ADL12487.1 GCN5-related N-acetyltransferase [Acetohalobium arabaticum DSM 5501]
MEQFVYANEGKVLLREAVQDDIPKIVELFDELPKNDYWQTEELAQGRYDLIDTTGGIICVAVLGEEIIGYTEVVLPDSKDDFGFVTKLQIDDEYKRRKFGTELVRYGMILTKKKGYVGSVVWPDIDKSKGLYKKIGFKEITDNQKVIFEVKEDLPSVEGESIKEISSLDEFKELELAVGSQYKVEFIWQRGFELAEEGLLNYNQPLIQKVSVDAGEGVIFFDNRHLFIAVAEEDRDDLDLITDLLQYGSKIAQQEGAEELLTYIHIDDWEEIKSDLEDIWEIKKDETRLEMKMEFED